MVRRTTLDFQDWYVSVAHYASELGSGYKALGLEGFHAYGDHTEEEVRQTYRDCQEWYEFGDHGMWAGNQEEAGVAANLVAYVGTRNSHSGSIWLWSANQLITYNTFPHKILHCGTLLTFMSKSLNCLASEEGSPFI